MSKSKQKTGPTEAELRKQTEAADKKAAAEQQAEAVELTDAEKAAKAKVSKQSAAIKAAVEKQKAEAERRAKAEAEKAERDAKLPRVADGKSITSRRGILGPGEAVVPADFREDAEEGAKVIADQIERGTLVLPAGK